MTAKDRHQREQNERPEIVGFNTAGRRIRSKVSIDLIAGGPQRNGIATILDRSRPRGLVNKINIPVAGDEKSIDPVCTNN